MAELIGIERDGEVAVLSLRRPEKMNAITTELRAAFIEAMAGLAADDRVAAVVLTGAGRAFSAGQDLSQAVAFTAADVPAQSALALRFFNAVRHLEKPCVVALNGIAAGAGFQLALMADRRIAHAGVRMGQPEVRAGLPSVIGSAIMSWYLGQAANVELSLTGRLLDAEEARALGLVSEIVPEAEVLGRAVEAAAELAALPPLAFRLTKRAFAEATDDALAAAIDKATAYQSQAYDSGEPARVMTAFLEGRGKA
jgi:enoyl-CoA hydratase/carnithine racemase